MQLGLWQGAGLVDRTELEDCAVARQVDWKTFVRLEEFSRGRDDVIFVYAARLLRNFSSA